MPQNPKLEIFQVYLKPLARTENTFRKFVECKTNATYEADTQYSFIFTELFRIFIECIDTDVFIRNEHSKKAFTAYDTRPVDERGATIHPHSRHSVIEGTIEGGKYGSVRNKSTIINKAEKEHIDKPTIILDKFYFSLYCPLHNNLGILMIQSYSTDTISDIFTKFIESFFECTGFFRKAKVTKFIPQSIVDEFKNNGIVKSFSYSRKELAQNMAPQAITVEEDELTIKITIESKKGIPRGFLANWRNVLGMKKFNEHELRNFIEQKAVLQNKNTEKKATFDISRAVDIKPIIYLNDLIDLTDEGIPNFEQLKEYCLTLLFQTIIPEIEPGHAVEER